MPINPITQSATVPGMANADLLYVVTSTTSSSPQFQFVCDVKYATGSAVLQRIKQQPNPDGYGVFNIGQIIGTYLDIDFPWKAKPFITSSAGAKTFYITFGEEYGTSTSSSVTLYNGITNVPNQAPNRAPYASTVKPLFVNGLVEPNSGDWNFDSGSFFTQSASPAGTTSFNKQYTLSDAPTTQKIQDGEYHTIALFNGSRVSGTVSAQDLYFYEVKVYDTASNNIQTINWYNIQANGGGPRTATGQVWSDIANYTETGSLLLYAGSGPQNFADTGSTLNPNWSYYTVTWYSQESAGIENTSGSYAQVTFVKDTSVCDLEGVRFAWKNKYGVWDYYTARLATNSSVQIERNAYEQSFVNYSTDTNPLPYNISRRGALQFYNKLDQTKTVTTDYLNQTDADWIKELIFSANVYIQEGTDFIPVVITNASVTEKSNPRSQKLYNYEISFKFANQQRARL